MAGYIVVFVLGILIGIYLPALVRKTKESIKIYIERKKVDYFLTQINYYKPIQKGDYPEVEDV